MTRSRWAAVRWWSSDHGTATASAPLTPDALMALGFLGGVAIGVVVWSRQQHRHRRDLFSRHPLRRLAALGLSERPAVSDDGAISCATTSGGKRDPSSDGVASRCCGTWRRHSTR